MLIEGIFKITLILATLLCSLVAGFLFAFASVVMPGIKNLSDREFIRTWKVIDRIIQDNQPIFVLVWVGSIVTLVASAILSIFQLDGIESLLMILALLAYLLAVQLPTFTINVPINNKLQALNVDDLDETNLNLARMEFEPPWLLWNSIRTIFAIVVSSLLIFLCVAYNSLQQ